MKKYFFLVLVFFSVSSSDVNAQCSYNLINISHVDCYNDNTGEVEISVTNNNLSWWRTLPDSSTSTNSVLLNLQAGNYVLHIIENFIQGDTSSPIVCLLIDTISIEQTIDITANFVLKDMCSAEDSANVTTTIYGGTPPYSTLWIHSGETTANISNVPPSNVPYTLNITDANGCQENEILHVRFIESLQSFMSAENVICKDDNSGEARVFIENGTPPYTFVWNTGDEFVNEESSKIENLYPGTYEVTVTDTMGCIISDSITIDDDPKICITVYRVFSPNEDGIHDYWEIENIHLYPGALIEVYDRMGNMVYRRRNYINSESIAFNGYATDGRRLPSGTYYFILDLENDDEVFKGSLTIVR